jgi:pimeloyl-ACP methyl ester carboxylesterase
VPFRLLTSWQGGRDLILLDQRGVGHSRPALDCAPIDDPASGLACRNRLTARGIDLSAYTTQENAADVAELGPALGCRQVNLFGYSYGSLLALTVMRQQPQHIRSVILLSPAPPQADAVTDWPGNVARAFKTLSGGCAHDPRCAAAYPHLGRDFRTAVTRLDARPRQLTVRSNGTDSTGQLTGRGLVGLLYQGINLGKMASLPRAIHRAGHTLVHSPIPTLIVTAQHDTGAPPAYGRLAAATLTRSYFTEFPGLAHIPEGPCAESVEANFLHQPLQRPGTSCIQRMPHIPWKTG